MGKKKTRPATSTGAKGPQKKKVENAPLTGKQLGFILLSYFGGAVTGNYLGKWSGLGGAGLVGVGIWKKNPYLASFGAGAALSAGQNAVNEKSLTGTEEEMEGFDFKKFLSDGNERAKNYFQTLGKKFMLSKPAAKDSSKSTTTAQENNSATTNGLNGEDPEEKPTYFIPEGNSLNDTSTDYMSKLDEQIKQLSGMVDSEEGTEGTDDQLLEDGRNY